MDASIPMTRHVMVVGPQFPLEAAHSLMERERIRHLPVVQGGHLMGMLSDRDVLLRATLSSDGTMVVPRDPVALAMTPAPITCGPRDQVGKLVRIMTERKIDAIPVLTAAGRMAGLVTSTDLLLLLLVDGEIARVLPFDFRLEEVRLSA